MLRHLVHRRVLVIEHLEVAGHHIRELLRLVLLSHSVLLDLFELLVLEFVECRRDPDYTVLVELLDGLVLRRLLLCALCFLLAHEANHRLLRIVLPILRLQQIRSDDLPELREGDLQLLVGHVYPDVLDVHVRLLQLVITLHDDIYG